MSVCTWDNCFRETKEVRGAELRNYLRIVTIAWGFGAIFFGAIGGTALPELSKMMGAPQFFFGLLGAAPFLGLVPQLPVSWLIEKTGKRKWLFIATCTTHRLLFLLMALIPFVIPQTWRTARLTALITTLYGSWVLAGCAGPTWNGWMGDMIPPRIRGRYWAFRRRVGLISSMLAALIAGWFIDYSAGTRLGVHGGISVIFAIAALLGSVDVLLFMFVPEIKKTVRGVNLTWRQLVAEPLQDRGFRQLMTYWFLLNFANAGIIGTFFQRNLREICQMQNWMVNAVLVVSPSIGWYMAVKWWGRARDRWGNKPILVLSSAAIVINPLIWCLVRPEYRWVGLVIPVYGGFVWAGIDMALCNALLGFSGGGRISSYPALTSIISGLGGILGPLVAGLLGQALGDWQIHVGPFTFVSYHMLFVMGASLQALTVPLALRIDEPAARSTREVLRVLYENATAMTRIFGYMPRRAAAVPVGGPDTEGRGLPAMATAIARDNHRGVRFYSTGRLYARQWSGRDSSIHNGVHSSSYNDYIMQLIEQAGREITEHAREASMKNSARAQGVKV